MATNLPRKTLTLRPEWEPDLAELKRTMFYDQTRSDVLRYLIDRGLKAWKEENKNSLAVGATRERY